MDNYNSAFFCIITGISVTLILFLFYYVPSFKKRKETWNKKGYELKMDRHGALTAYSVSLGFGLIAACLHAGIITAVALGIIVALAATWVFKKMERVIYK